MHEVDIKPIVYKRLMMSLLKENYEELKMRHVVKGHFGIFEIF